MESSHVSLKSIFCISSGIDTLLNTKMCCDLRGVISDALWFGGKRMITLVTRQQKRTGVKPKSAILIIDFLGIHGWLCLISTYDDM